MDNNIDFVTLTNYLKENILDPKDYVIEKFKSNDVVLLAESHAIKDNLLFVQEIIPKLYECGIYNIGMEFGASEDQQVLDTLVTSEYYDEELARDLMFSYNVIFPYKEYWDVYKIVWKLNKSLPEGARKFRVLNLSYKYNWKVYNGIKNIETISKVFHQGGTEKYRANIVQKEIFDKQEKILILTGKIHAFTKYKHPTYDFLADEFVRLEDGYFGNLLYKVEPEKVYTIMLHSMFSSIDQQRNLLPADGQIEELMAAVGNPQAGIDLETSPIGQLRDYSYYSLGHRNFKLKDIADGYIFFKPLQEQSGCTIDYDFLKNHTLEEVLDNFPDPEWHVIPKTLDDYWELVEEYVDMKKRHQII